MPVTPVRSEKKTSGTTSIFNALTNMVPTIAKKPLTICVSMKAESIMSKRTPTTMPRPMAIMIFAVSDSLPEESGRWVSVIASLP